MSGNVWGADVAQLRMLAQQFGQTAEKLQFQASTLGGQINNNPSWKGHDAVAFRSEWNGNHKALLLTSVQTLKTGSKTLLTQADEQEKASNAVSGAGGGPLPGGGPNNGWAGFGLAGTGALVGLKGFLADQKVIKAPFTVAKHAAQFGWVMNKNQDGFLRGYHRVGGPVFSPNRLLQSPSLEGLLKGSSTANKGVGIAEKVSDLASLKNLNQYIGPLSKFEGVFKEQAWLGKGTNVEWLGKSGLARGLGWAGIGFNAFDTYKNFAAGDSTEGAKSLGKTLLGVACFLPPPAGTVAQVASAGIAIYENWDTISSVGNNIGEGIVNAVKDPGKFVSDAGKTIGDAGKSVSKFLGFGG